MDLKFAEFIGIFIGDGSLNIREWKNSYEFKFTGNIKDEQEYYNEHVSKLVTKILGRKINGKNLDCGRSYGLYFCSKQLSFELNRIGIYGGSKAATIEIPKTIVESDELSIQCLRGIFDTDGCFRTKKNNYPVITLVSKSKKLIQQIDEILDRLEIKHCMCFDIQVYDKRYNRIYTKNALYINGRINTKKWFDIVGTNNPKNRIKYEKYKILRTEAYASIRYSGG